MPKKRKNRKDAGKEEESPGGEEQTRKKIRFHVAFLVLIGSFAVLTLVSLILVLFLGFFLAGVCSTLWRRSNISYQLIES